MQVAHVDREPVIGTLTLYSRELVKIEIPRNVSVETYPTKFLIIPIQNCSRTTPTRASCDCRRKEGYLRIDTPINLLC